ncbi:9590_t:CDS:2 [Diversispora eburnea]|uniref:9590_t:CDS:1 n=1 Tax=Diversispora eburnea TaxID=1213867 RepID=A0A9N9CDE7_9GLOM|nr:9590_t:CDS:2 [Diversispora eburnea]
MEKGTQPKLTVSDDEYIPRPGIINLLKRIFQPSKNHSYYHVVCGEHGTGKTSLFRIVANEVEQGVIYVDIPPNFNKLDDKFGKALNFSFEEDISITLKLKKRIFDKTETMQSYSKWEKAMDVFMRASEVYKAKHGKLPVIIYDNVSRLVHKNSEILDILQDEAKDNADNKKYIAVFDSSEGSVSRRMEYNMQFLVMYKKPIIEIGDLSKEESMKYLTKKCKINKVKAKKLYELVGGHIVTLKSVTDDFIAGQSFENIKTIVFNNIYDNFKKAKINSDQTNYEMAKIIIRALLNSNNVLHVSMLRKLTKVEPNEFLENNVFAYHLRNKTVTFQSHSTECYIQKNANKFIK